MSDKPHFSPSQMGMFARCGEQYRRRYILGEKLPPGIALITGYAVHKSIEANMRHKRDTKGQMLSLAEVQEVARNSVNERWENEEVDLSDEEEEKGEKVVRGQTVDTAVALSGCHHTNLAPSIFPVHIERKIEVNIKGFDHTLIGIIDLQEENRVRDTKTRAASPPKGTSDKMLQLTAYSALVKSVDGEFPELAVDYLIKSKKPNAVTEFTTRGERDYKAFLRRLEVMSDLIRKESFSPAIPEYNYLCNPKFCGYHATCEYV